ncbi:protein kinase [Kribbella sp. NPDC005582]|uniref:serine/threonine-protein kinase n=1 Tax=Kribbella sp. NPDC005582 TaxID=3156893 RepID=UPI0033BA88BE
MDPGSLVAGRYRLEEELGQGGMGSVWRAVDQELGREVALKRAIVGTIGQIRREAKVGAGVLHPNVVAVFDTVVDGDTQWLVTEYVPATSLDRMIETGGPLPEARVLAIGAQLATALVAIHERGIVHRDLKPANVLVTDDDVVKLTDLGIARWTEVTQTGGAQLTGTLGYVAPEVANGSEATAASDVFSLGATLYAAVEGGSPWGDGADGPFSQMQRAAKGTPLPYRHARKLAPLLDALMEPDPAHRPSAAEAAGLFQGNDVPRRSWKRHLRSVRRGTVLTAVAAVVVVGAVLLAWLLPRGTTPQAATTNPISLGPDPTAADPCALIPADALREFGEAFVDPEVRNYASCVISSTLKDGTGQVQTALEFTGPEEYPSRPVVPGQMGEIERSDEKEGSCDRAVTLPDTNRLTITTFRINKAKRAKLCPFAESLIQDVMAVLSKGPPARRADLPANSLDKVDACKLIDAAEAGKALGASGQPVPDFGHWGCSWEAESSELSAKFTREWPIEPDNEWGGTVIKVGNRNARLIPDSENKAACTAMVVHRLYTPRLPVLKGTAPKREEVVTVELVDTDAPNQAAVCAKTRAAAEAVVRRLPDVR